MRKVINFLDWSIAVLGVFMLSIFIKIDTAELLLASIWCFRLLIVVLVLKSILRHVSGIITAALLIAVVLWLLKYNLPTPTIAIIVVGIGIGIVPAKIVSSRPKD